MFLSGVADGGRGALRDRVPDPDSAVAVGAAAAVLRHSTGMVKKNISKIDEIFQNLWATKVSRRLRDGRGDDLTKPWTIFVLCRVGKVLKLA